MDAGLQRRDSEITFHGNCGRLISGFGFSNRYSVYFIQHKNKRIDVDLI